MSTLYRILSAADWERARAAAVFRGSAHDERDGYIHLSAAHQVLETAAKHYANQADLVLLYIPAAALVEPEHALRWEASRGGDSFPHLYGALPVAAVSRVERLPLGADGKHQFPPLED
jgi:uncharacterized protein (DUF952 family)